MPRLETTPQMWSALEEHCWAQADPWSGLLYLAETIMISITSINMNKLKRDAITENV